MEPSKALNPNIKIIEKFNIGIGTLHGWMTTILCSIFKSPNLIPLWDCRELMEPI